MNTEGPGPDAIERQAAWHGANRIISYDQRHRTRSLHKERKNDYDIYDIYDQLVLILYRQPYRWRVSPIDV